MSLADGSREDRRAELLERNAELETRFYLELNEAQCLDVASGYVPNSVKALARTMLDWAEEDERRAARPVQKPKMAKKESTV